MWIKICGMTTSEAVTAALDAQVQAIGFVFAESVRQLTPELAVQLAAAARGRIRCVAVMQHPTQHQLDEVLATFRPDVLQTDAADLSELAIPQQLETLPVMRGQMSGALPARVLFEGLISGSGQPGDWLGAREMARRSQLVLAGGLNPENVAAAIDGVRPFGVDVSSGVEERRGTKSPAQIERFVIAARAAFAALAVAPGVIERNSP
jgi:phosphoribosylanthranilate isomerase